MKYINKEHQEKLAVLLESIPDDQLDMGFFLVDTGLEDCGTVGCVAGWNAHNFHTASLARKLDLSMVPYESWLAKDLGVPVRHISTLTELYNWPDDLQELYETDGHRAEAMAAAVRRFDGVRIH